MKRRNVSSALAVVFMFVAGSALTATPTSEPLMSKKERGTVSVATEPALSDGRLIFKVVAFNASTQPAGLSRGQVKVFTASGKAIDTESVAELIDTVRGSAPRSSNTTHPPSTYSRPNTTTGSRGQIDISGGMRPANDPHAQGAIDRSDSTQATEAADIDQQIETLKQAILQDLTIEPGQAAGGQVVTSRLKFGRREPRELRVTVTFNGELHEFAFDAPPEG